MQRRSVVLFAAPQVLTASRLVVGTAALIAAIDGRLYMAATLICLGAVTDGLDGFLARRFDAASAFGALFDYFADYVCYVVAPWAMARELLDPGPNVLEESALAVPLLTAAVRYARNGLIVADPRRQAEDGGVPGLGTIYFAFLMVAAVFLDVRELLGESPFAIALPLFIVVFSILMVSPIRYPKLAQFHGAWPIVLALVAIMPFFATKPLAAAMFMIGLLYPLLAPVLINGVRPHFYVLRKSRRVDSRARAD